jgi:hypothetical protein
VVKHAREVAILIRTELILMTILVGAVLTGCSEAGSGDTRAPSEVTDLSARTGDSHVDLSWHDPGAGDLSRIRISWTPEHGERQPKPVIADTEKAAITGLTNDTEYTFTVKTVDASGNTSSGVSVEGMPRPPLAFSSDRDGDAEIYVMDAAGTNQTRLTNDAANEDTSAWAWK